MKHALLVTALVLGSASAFAADKAAPTTADNTARNSEERSVLNPTADQQSNKEQDIEITRKIRASLMEKKDLSTYAQNIKIITQNGMVTLRGPVRTAAEKSEADRIARATAGATAVQNELTIAR